MLTQELMKKVRQLQLSTGRAVDEVFAGQYASAFRGRGMEFADVRAYQPGDDVRSIDWNVTARAGEPFIKQFVEERELTIVLAVDLSASGSFGSVERPKNETSAELCAVLAYAATRSNDRVGLLVFTDEVELWVPPKKGRNHVQRIIREVLEFDPSGRGTDAAGAIAHLRTVLHKRSVIFVVSDWLFPGAFEATVPGAAGELDRALRTLNRRHDVIAVQIADPRERALPRGVGLIRLRDAETGRAVTIDAGSARVRRRFAERAAERDEVLGRRMRRAGIDLVRVRTHEPYVHALVELFRARGRRR